MESFEDEDESLQVDYTKVPYELERKFEELDENNALRPTTIVASSVWNKTFHKSLLSEAEKKTVSAEVHHILFVVYVVGIQELKISFRNKKKRETQHLTCWMPSPSQEPLQWTMPLCMSLLLLLIVSINLSSTLL